MMIKTKIDKLFEMQEKAITLKNAIELTDISKKELEDILEALENVGAIELYYLPLPFTQPRIKIKPFYYEYEKQKIGKEKEKYEIKSNDGLYKAEISIMESKDGLTYNIDYPIPGPLTSQYLNAIADKIFATLPAETFLISEEERKQKLYEKQVEEALKFFKDITYNEEDALLLAGILKSQSFGIGKIDYILADPEIEEVVINNAFTPLIVYHRRYGWLKTNIKIGSEEEIVNISSKIARRSGRQITILTPLLDAHLIKGERVNATLYPISIRGNTITIRKFSEEPYTIPFLIKNGTLNVDMASLLWQAIELEMNMLIIGGTATGKTTLLNALLMLINNKQRLITIEDTKELNLPETFENYVSLLTREPNPEGLGQVTLLDLMINALRMRPDRIIVGEIRRKEEAIVLFEAMHTGHSVYSTFHADTAYIAVKRLTEEPIALPYQELEVLDFFVTLRRDKKTGLRRIFEIGQFLSKEASTVTERVYVHRARTDTFDYLGLPVKYIEKIALYTGMTNEEIEEDIKQKSEILKYAVKHNFISPLAFSNFIQNYYEDNTFYDKIKKGLIKVRK
ncbi:MAG: type II/IV secretion system ATPase subunit [Candidatus Anstonellales archaeon]